jgi:hypothetical protein
VGAAVVEASAGALRQVQLAVLEQAPQAQGEPVKPYRYSVTYEFATRRPETHAGTVEGTTPAVRAARAIRQAHKVIRPINYISVVVLVMSPGVMEGMVP